MSPELLKVITAIGVELHPDQVSSIARKVAEVPSAEVFVQRIYSSVSPTSNRLIGSLKVAWIRSAKVAPKEVASALLAASATSEFKEKSQKVDLVWTGPQTGLVASRHTEQVVLEVIRSAIKEIFIVSFVAYDFDSLKNALLVASKKGVHISILLESPKSKGGKVDIDAVSAFREAVPKASVYTWRNDLISSGHIQGAVHAKCVVADDNLAFISSANLTRAAMENNMELGVLVKGGALPHNLQKHLQSLVDADIIGSY